MTDRATTEQNGIQDLALVAIIDGQERPVNTQVRVARGLRHEPPTDLFVVAGSQSGRGTQAGQLIGAVIENELRRAPGKIARNLRGAIDAAHVRLHEKAERSPHLDWTASVACVLIIDGELIFAGIGQTAAFLLRDGQLELIEDASAGGRSWLDTRLGGDEEPQVNMCGGTLEPGDRVLIVVGHLPPHISGTRLRYQLQSSPDQIVQELRSSVTPEDCLAALAFAWEPAAQSGPVLLEGPQPPAEDGDEQEPMQFPAETWDQAEAAMPASVAVGDGRPAPRVSRERDRRPRAQIASAAFGGSWRPAGVAGGRSRTAAEPDRRTAGRRIAGASNRSQAANEAAGPGFAQIGLSLARRVMREFLPGEQASSAAGFVQTSWRSSTAARSAGRPLGRGWLIGAAVGLVFLFAVGFFAVQVGLDRQDPRQEFATAYGQAEAARAAAVGAPDREVARKNLAAAETALKSALAIIPNEPQAVALQEQVQMDMKRLNGVVALPNVSQLADLGALAGSATNATALIYQNGRAYIVDSGSGQVFRFVITAQPEGMKVEDKPTVLFAQDEQISDIKLGTPVSLLWATADNGRPSTNLLVMDAFRNLYQFNSPTEAIKLPVRGAADWKSFKQATSYQGNLYILDTEGDQVWRYYPAAGGYDSEMKPMLESAELSDVTGFAVDGDVYLMTANGDVRKYVGGVAKDFKPAGLDTPIGKGAKLWTDRDSKLLYVADPANSRVVTLDKNGVFKSQMVDERFRTVSTLSVDEKGKTLYFVGGNQFFAAPLPAEVASTG